MPSTTDVISFVKKGDVVEIHESGLVYRMNRESLIGAIANVKSERRVFTNQFLYLRMLRMFRDALKVLNS